jgi:hypothetical protein
MDVTDELAMKLRLLQTPQLQQAKDWSKRTRKLMQENQSADKAAITAATTVFAADFDPIKYRYDREDDPKASVEALLEAIDAA